jgi:hypothetical protein
MDMDLSFLDALGPDARDKYIEFLLYHYKVVDAFWYIGVENERGPAEADAVNEFVWANAGKLGARHIKQRFNIEAKGLEGFRQVSALYPWTLLAGYQFRDEGDALIIEVPHCPPQEGRLKHGKGEYACKAMHKAEFEAFAREIDPAIRVACDFAPPDQHPRGLWCRWRFTMADDQEKQP